MRSWTIFSSAHADAIFPLLHSWRCKRLSNFNAKIEKLWFCGDATTEGVAVLQFCSVAVEKIVPRFTSGVRLMLRETLRLKLEIKG
jgi:hypothetical protein